MPQWNLFFTSEAEKDLARMDKAIRSRILDKLEWLSANFDNIVPLALSSEWRGFFKLRTGSWRIIYQIDWEKQHIIVRLIDKRDKIYKKPN